MVERRERCQLSLLPSLSSNDYHHTFTMTAGNSRCVVERLSPCLSSTLIGRLVGDYRAVWRWSYLTVIVIIGFSIITIIIILRWELEERYKETADKGRVSFLLIISAKTELMISILFYFNRLLQPLKIVAFEIPNGEIIMLTGSYSSYNIDEALSVTKDSCSLKDRKSAKQQTVETSKTIVSL